MKKKSIMIILIITLILNTVYLYTKINKSNYDINIATPVVSENGNTGINYLNFKPISNEDDFNLITFYIMDADFISKPKICENIPNSIITFYNKQSKIEYYKVNIWINGDSLIIKGDNERENNYKLIESNRSKDIIKIIEKYKK